MNTQEFNNLSKYEKNETLLDYIRNQDTENIQSALQHGADVNYTTPQGYTPLYESVGTGNQQIVSMLLDASAEINVPGDKINGPPFVWAAKKSDVNIMKLLLEPARKEAERKAKEEKKGTIQEEKEEKEDPINMIHTKNGSGDTPLHVACNKIETSVVPFRDKENAILFLVNNGADLTIQNKSRQRPLDIFAEKYVEDYEKSISQWKEIIHTKEKEKEKIKKKAEKALDELQIILDAGRAKEEAKARNNFERLYSQLTEQQERIDKETKKYLQPLLDNKERGENLIKTILEKVLDQKIPLKNISHQKAVKKIYNEIMKVREAAKKACEKNGVPEEICDEILGYVHNGGKQKKRKTRKPKKSPSKKRKTSKKR